MQTSLAESGYTERLPEPSHVTSLFQTTPLDELAPGTIVRVILGKAPLQYELNISIGRTSETSGCIEARPVVDEKPCRTLNVAMKRTPKRSLSRKGSRVLPSLGIHIKASMPRE